MSVACYKNSLLFFADLSPSLSPPLFYGIQVENSHLCLHWCFPHERWKNIAEPRTEHKPKWVKYSQSPLLRSWTNIFKNNLSPKWSTGKWKNNILKITSGMLESVLTDQISWQSWILASHGTQLLLYQWFSNGGLWINNVSMIWEDFRNNTFFSPASTDSETGYGIKAFLFYWVL
jgi:hypothetical protein